MEFKGNTAKVTDVRADEEENTHSCLQIGGTIFSSVMVQEAWFKVCDSGAVVQRVWWVNPTSTTRNDTFPGKIVIVVIKQQKEQRWLGRKKLKERE
ncbi:hypothetical protein Tco_1278054 [Tanacetum coccineum]